MILRFGLQASLCNLCREVYNETKAGCFLSVFAVALREEGVDRNRDENVENQATLMSPSARRAWIEILLFSAGGCLQLVALLAEGVDRNLFVLLVVVIS